MVTEYGMSDRMGLVTYERPPPALVPPGKFCSEQIPSSEEKAAQIDAEIARFIDEAHQRVKKILSERRKVLDELAHLLRRRKAFRERNSERCCPNRNARMVN